MKLSIFFFIILPQYGLILAQDTGSILQQGFSIYGLQNMNVQYNYGIAAGSWNPTVSTSGGAYFGSPLAVWTGSLILLYDNNYVYRFDPATNTFTQSSINSVAGFQARYGYNAVWTGTHMIIWGGSAGVTAFSDGVLYDPATDSWSSIAAAPVKRVNSSSAWTGTDMIVFGGDSIAGMLPSCVGLGFSSKEVYKYNLAGNSWTGPISVTGTVPSARRMAVAAWTGTEMLVYGGSKTADGTCAGKSHGLNDIYSFNPATNVWTQKVSDMQFDYNVGAWDGSKLYIWGTTQFNENSNSLGRVYTLSTNSWAYFPNAGARLGANNTFAVWDGSGLAVCDGVTYQLFNPSIGSGIIYSLPISSSFYLLKKN